MVCGCVRLIVFACVLRACVMLVATVMLSVVMLLLALVRRRCCVCVGGA